MSAASNVAVGITGHDSSGPAFNQAVNNVNRLTGAVTTFGNRQRNMAFQLNDVFTQLSTGTSLLQVAMQQGPQIAQIYGFGNGGVGAAFRDLGGMVMATAKRMGPLGIAAAAAAATLTYEVNRATGETYSMGEVFTATMDVIGKSIKDMVMPAVSAIEPTVSSTLGRAMDTLKGFGNFVVSVNLAWIAILKRSVSEIPDLFKWMGAEAGNFFAGQIEHTLNSVARAVNLFIAGINSMFDALPENLRPGKLGMLSPIELPRFDAQSLKAQLSNPFKGIGTELGGIFGKDYLGAAYKAIGSEAAQNRLEEAMKKAAKGAKGARGRTTAKDREDPYNQFDHPLYGGNWRELGDMVGVVKDEMSGLETAMQDVGGLFQSIFDKAIEGGLKFKDVLGSLQQFAGKMASRAFGQLIDALFQPQHPLYGGGGVGALFGGLFGGFRAEGGAVQAGRAYVVGEQRPELFVPGTNGTIVPDIPQAGGATTITFAPSIVVQGNADDRAMRQALAEAQRNWKAQLPGLLRDAQRRGRMN